MVSQRRTSTIVLYALLASVSCGGGGGGVLSSLAPRCEVSSVTVTPSSAIVAVGATTTLAASVVVSNCNPVPTAGWESSAITVATVSNTGVVTGVSPGTAIVTATTGGRSGTSAITVNAPVANISLTSPSPSVSIGSTLQVTAQARDAGGNVLTGRTFTWQTSNAVVATVSTTGLVSGVTPGTTTITATSEGRTAQLSVTVIGAASLTITSITPAANATDVRIASTVQIQFSAPISAATVTASTVRVSAGATAVAGVLTVNGNTVTLTPATPLTEFNTVYTVTVTTGVLSTTGNFLAAQSVSTFTTLFVESGFYYRITNQALALDTFANSFQCFMIQPFNATGQFWYFTPVAGTPGGYTMRNQFQGDPRGLEAADGVGPCLLTVFPTTGGIATGQIWIPVPFAQFPGTYRLQTVSFGSQRSLDATVATGAGSPRMLPTANIAAQAWTFARIGPR